MGLSPPAAAAARRAPVSQLHGRPSGCDVSKDLIDLAGEAPKRVASDRGASASSKQSTEILARETLSGARSLNLACYLVYLSLKRFPCILLTLRPGPCTRGDFSAIACLFFGVPTFWPTSRPGPVIPDAQLHPQFECQMFTLRESPLAHPKRATRAKHIVYQDLSVSFLCLSTGGRRERRVRRRARRRR